MAPEPSSSKAQPRMHQSPAGSSVGGKRAKSLSMAAPRDESPSSESESEPDGRKRKRNRMSLACSSCKKRKIKCDRMLPVCGPCSKRGQGDTCQFDALVQHELPPSIARSAEVHALLQRVQHVERYLGSLPPSYATFKPYVPQPAERDTDLPVKQPPNGNGNGSALPGRTTHDPAEDPLSETEDAAANLEAGVFAKGLKDTGGAAVAAVGSSTRELRFGGRAQELTKALTSIVAPPDRHPNSLTAVLDVAFDASQAEIEQAKAAALSRLHQALPSRAVQSHLVRLYFQSVSWLFHVLHPSSFILELEAFHGMLDDGRESEVDPLFLGLLLMVLCVALDSTHASRSPLSLDQDNPLTPNPLSDIPEDKLKQLPERWFNAAQRALALAEWETFPRVRAIVTIILFTHYLQLSSANRGQPSQLVTWLAGAIRQAQVLGLNRLGSNAEVMPAEDAAWPPGKNSLKRESAKRIWAVLVYQDWLGASSRNRSYLISPLHFDTDDPSNLNDAELSPIDWRVNPAPGSVLTDTSSDRIRIAMARQVRRTADTLVLSAREVTHEVILDLDRGYRDILDAVPASWTHSREENEQPMLRFQRHFALEGIHNRIFRLHRPFSTRGYRNPNYRSSTDACIKSARIVIVSTHNIRFATRDIWFSYSHVMGAALVLFNDLFHAIDNDSPAAEIDDTRETLLLAQDIFSASQLVSSPSLSQIVHQGSLIIGGLLRAEESRRTARAAKTLLAASGVEDSTDEPETFAEVLQRVSRSLNAHEARHRGTPPPTRNIPSKKGRSSGPGPAPGLTASGFPLFGTVPAANGADSVPLAVSSSLGPMPSTAAIAFDPTDLPPWPFPKPETADSSFGFGASQSNQTIGAFSALAATATGTDDLGYQFFSDLGMQAPIPGAHSMADDFWAAGPVGGAGALFGQNGATDGAGLGGAPFASQAGSISGWDGLSSMEGMGGW